MIIVGMISTPLVSSCAATALSLKRDTAMTRRERSAMARRAMRARLGPILPPAPRTITSPSIASRAATVSSSGAARRASSEFSEVGALSVADIGAVGRWGTAYHGYEQIRNRNDTDTAICEQYPCRFRSIRCYPWSAVVGALGCPLTRLRRSPWHAAAWRCPVRPPARGARFRYARGPWP